MYDDDAYVTENPVVRGGITREGVAWAFRTTHFIYWQPVNWLSHMAVVELFGLHAGFHHMANVLLHSMNAVLLFLVLFRMTGGLWQSAFAAALFAVHPQHVESVAWVAERKDVLSTFFWLLAIGAYHRYVVRPGAGRYCLVLFLFLLGLMAKPMVMTLPLTLLLLDYWPLRRFPGTAGEDRAGEDAAAGRRRAAALFREKAPFFLLAVLSAAVTLLSPELRTTAVALGRLSLGDRIANAAVSAATYMGKMVWPSSLAVFYPHPETSIPSLHLALSALLLFGVSAVVLRLGRRFPYLPAGWGWYLATILPVLGLVQVGGQAMADRYTYVPFIGLFVMVSWGMSDIAARWRRLAPPIALAAGAAVLAFAAASWIQTGYWRDDRTLFSRALEVTKDNYLAEMNLGVALEKEGRTDEAIARYRNAIRIRPAYAEAHYNLGVAMERKGKAGEAIGHYRRALAIRPSHPYAHNNLGQALFGQGEIEEAIRHYREAIRLRPDFALAHSNLGSALGRLGRLDEAVPHFREALRIRPGLAGAHYNLGIALILQGKPDEAIAHFREALRFRPGDPTFRQALDRALLEQGMGAGK